MTSDKCTVSCTTKGTQKGKPQVPTLKIVSDNVVNYIDESSESEEEEIFISRMYRHSEVKQEIIRRTKLRNYYLTSKFDWNKLGKTNSIFQIEECYRRSFKVVNLSQPEFVNEFHCLDLTVPKLFHF